MFIARKSTHIEEDLKRGWSSWNFGQDGLNATEEQIEAWKEECKANDMPFTISGFELWGDEMDNADIRELYPNYWVLVDDRFDGSIAGSKLRAENLNEAIEESAKCDFSGDGVSINIEDAVLVYSKGDIHIFEI